MNAVSIRIDITDAAGRKIASINEGGRSKGDYYVQWSKANLAPGAYYARMYVDGIKSATVGIVKVN